MTLLDVALPYTGLGNFLYNPNFLLLFLIRGTRGVPPPYCPRVNYFKSMIYGMLMPAKYS